MDLTNQDVIASKDFDYSDEDAGFWAEETFQMIQCMGCDYVSLRSIYTGLDVGDGTIETETLYPHRDEFYRKARDYKNLPHVVSGLYAEVIETFVHSHKILCAAGVRALIEGVCKQKHVTGGNVFQRNKSGPTKTVFKKDLRGKIEGLLQKGLITKQESKALHQLRFLGNEALHELEPPHRKNLKTAIDIIEHLLESLYEIGEKADQIKENKKARHSAKRML